MKAERALLRTGEYLVGRACRGLPPTTRDRRYREWTAELPAILHDPQIGHAPLRAVRMLGYAADTLRGTAMMRGPGRRRASAIFTPVLGVIFAVALVTSAWSVWETVQAPGNWVNYVRVAWSLLLTAWPVSHYVRATARTTGLIFVSSCLAGIAVYIGDAVQAPGDWANYFWAASQFLFIVVFLCLVAYQAMKRRRLA
jgi:hypothetical protein